MKDFHSVNILNCDDNTADKKFTLILREFVDSSNMISEVTSGQQIHDQVEIITIVESELNVGNKVVS